MSVQTARIAIHQQAIHGDNKAANSAVTAKKEETNLRFSEKALELNEDGENKSASAEMIQGMTTGAGAVAMGVATCCAFIPGIGTAIAAAIVAVTAAVVAVANALAAINSSDVKKDVADGNHEAGTLKLTVEANQADIRRTEDRIKSDGEDVRANVQQILDADRRRHEAQTSPS